MVKDKNAVQVPIRARDSSKGESLDTYLAVCNNSERPDKDVQERLTEGIKNIGIEALFEDSREFPALYDEENGKPGCYIQAPNRGKITGAYEKEDGVYKGKTEDNWKLFDVNGVRYGVNLS